MDLTLCLSLPSTGHESLLPAGPQPLPLLDLTPTVPTSLTFYFCKLCFKDPLGLFGQSCSFPALSLGMSLVHTRM